MKLEFTIMRINRFSANATTFYNQYKDKIETDGNVLLQEIQIFLMELMVKKRISGKAETQGLEVGTKIPFTDNFRFKKQSLPYMESEQKSGKNKGEFIR